MRGHTVRVISVVWLHTLSCSFCISAAMKTSCLVDKEPGLPLSLPPSSTDVRLEVEEAELGRGLVGSLVTSEAGVLVSTCATPAKVRAEHRWHRQVLCVFTIPLRGTWRSAHRAAG